MKAGKLLLVDVLLAALAGLFWTGISALFLDPAWLPAVWLLASGVVLVCLVFMQAAGMALRERG